MCLHVWVIPVLLGTGTTWCRRLSVLPEVASVPDPPESVMLGVVASRLAPLESPIVGVVVSVYARPFPLLVGPAVSVVFFPTLVSVCGPNRCPPGLLRCRDCVNNWIEHCAHYPNPIQGRNWLLDSPLPVARVCSMDFTCRKLLKLLPSAVFQLVFLLVQKLGRSSV